MQSTTRNAAQDVRARLTAASTVAIQLCGRPGVGKTTVVDRLATSLTHLEAVGIVTPALARTDPASVTPEEARIWKVEGVDHLVAENLLAFLDRLPLHHLDYLFVEENRDPTSRSLSDLGCHARAVVLSATGGLGQVDEAAKAIRRAHFVLFTQGDQAVASPSEMREACRRVRVIAEIPTFLLSHKQHSEWMEWIAFLHDLRRHHLCPHEVASDTAIFFG